VKVIKLPPERIPDKLPVRSWLNKKDKKINWEVENSQWRRTSDLDSVD
jgi:hypothetical protein